MAAVSNLWSEAPSPRGVYAASIGFFDGVHRGHQWLIRQVRDEALRRGCWSMLVTFDRHPRTVFAPESAPPALTPAATKMQLLRATGIDEIFVLPFDRAMAALSAREFMGRVLRDRLGVGTLVIGYDHHFGRPQTPPEHFADYRRYGVEEGMDVVEAVELPGGHVSSSSIRCALADGDIAAATAALGRPYAWTGHVVHGHAVGRRLGFPTANLAASDPSQLLPARGVYAVWAAPGQGAAAIPAMLNIGRRPTLEQNGATTVEAHLLDFSGNLYDQQLTLTFIARLREERRFDNEARLAAQLQLDREAARKALGC